MAIYTEPYIPYSNEIAYHSTEDTKGIFRKLNWMIFKTMLCAESF